jgi:hypothetical protein
MRSRPRNMMRSKTGVGDERSDDDMLKAVEVEYHAAFSI